MACYFGCATKANLIAYLVALILVIVGIGLLIATGEEWVDCLEALDECGKARGLPDLGPRYMEAYFRDPMIFANPAGVCHLWYSTSPAMPATISDGGGSNVTQPAEPPAAAAGRAVPNCAYCAALAKYCIVPYTALFYLGVALLVLAFLPCCFCCFCSKRPLPVSAKGAD